MDMICWVLTDLSGNVDRLKSEGHDPTPEQVTPPRGRMETQNHSRQEGGDPAREERLGLLCQGPDGGAGVIFCAVMPSLKGPGQSSCGLSREGKNGRGFLGF